MHLYACYPWCAMIIYHHISSYIIIYHHIPSYINTYHHIASYIIIYHHISSYIITYHHISSYIITYHHISSSIIIYLVSNRVIRCIYCIRLYIYIYGWEDLVQECLVEQWEPRVIRVIRLRMMFYLGDTVTIPKWPIISGEWISIIYPDDVVWYNDIIWRDLIWYDMIYYDIISSEWYDMIWNRVLGWNVLQVGENSFRSALQLFLFGTMNLNASRI